MICVAQMTLAPGYCWESKILAPKILVKGLAAKEGAVLGLSGSSNVAGSDALWRQLRGSMGNMHSA